MNPKDKARKLHKIIINAVQRFPVLNNNSKLYWNIFDENLEENSDIYVRYYFETSYNARKLDVEEKRLLEAVLTEQEQKLTEVLINNTKDFDSFPIRQYSIVAHVDHPNPWIYHEYETNKLQFGREFKVKAKEVFGDLPDLRNILKLAIELYRECNLYKERFYEHRESLMSNNHESFYKFAPETVKKMIICSKGTEGIETFKESMISATKMYKKDVQRLLGIPIDKEKINIFTNNQELNHYMQINN